MPVPMPVLAPRSALPALAAAAALVLTPAPQAAANDLLIGLGVGGILGYAIGREQARQQQARQPHVHPAPGGAARADARARPAHVRGDVTIQRALNHFGYEAGPEDGVFGPRTRAAIRRYQAASGEAQTGSLTPEQRSALLAAHARATRAAAAPAPVATGAAGAGAALLAGLAIAAAPAAAGAVPLAALCEADASPVTAIAFQAQPPGGAAELVADSYCAARAAALDATADIVAQIPAFDAAAALTQCKTWAPTQRGAVTAALAQPAPAAAVALRAAVPAASEAERAQLAGSFVLCHGLAQVEGDAATASVFAPLAAAAGLPGYGEIVAGALALGLGPAAQDRARAADWYRWTAAELDAGGAALAGEDRAPLLLALADTAPAVLGDAAALIARRAAAPALPVVLPGLPAPIQPDAALAALLRPGFQRIYGMPFDQGLAACAAGGAEVLRLGLATCKALAEAAGRADLAARFADQIAALR